jgi:NAD(P)-dependent dehydrogenase (short-subunit alcohol dehydrogenase family)
MSRLKILGNMTGRRVLVTGGTGHLGRVIAETVAEQGASVVILDRPGSDFEEVEIHLRDIWSAECESIVCDLENETARDIVIKKILNDGKPLNCLVNNAAFVGSSNLKGWGSEFQTQSLETWRRAMEVNLTAPFHLAQGLSSILRRSPGANILNITSIYAEQGPDWRLYEGTPMGNPAAYSASKAGLAQLTRWLATTLAPDVRVNAIAPGGISRGQPGMFCERYISHVPQKRMALEDDLRGALAFLISDLSAYVTGQVLTVDGGLSVW